MWDYVLLAVVLIAIAAMTFIPTIGVITGGKAFDNVPPKCATCPKQAARESMDSQ